MVSSSPVFTSDTRAAYLEQLRTQSFDVLVIGGGITGAGIARDAALRGFKTALVEKGDFASGTSGNSARIIHGGLRYIESFQFGVVLQASAEQRVLDKLAPHMVMPLPSTVPLTSNWKRSMKVQTAIWIYDALALYRNIHLSRRLTQEQWGHIESKVQTRGSGGAIQYWERTADDARLTLLTIQSACRNGAVALNSLEVVELCKSHGQVVGASVCNGLTGEILEIRAKTVVNAAGPWTDRVHKLDKKNYSPSVRPNKGIHVVVPHNLFPIAGQVIFPSAGGTSRMMYAIPWQNTSLIGTTDTDYDGDLEAISASQDEVKWIIESVNQAYTNVHLDETDVVSTFAGLRPLVPGDSGKAYRASRDHKISVSPSGLISIAGGKLTTHRAMAQDVVDVVSARLHRKTSCTTANTPMDATFQSSQDVAAQREYIQSLVASWDETHLQYLLSTYGSQSREVLRLAAEDKDLNQFIVDGLPYRYAQIHYAIAHEQANTLSDVLIRRTRLIHEAPAQGLSQAHSVAVFMGKQLGWNEVDIEKEVRAYHQQVALTRNFDPNWRSVA